MKRTLIALSLAAMALSYPAAYAKENGGITPQMLERMKAGMDLSPSKKAVRNALSGNHIDKLASNPDAKNSFDTHFSHRVKSEGITDQHSSGRCWLFTGLNMLLSLIHI